jgi:hypothetical protein
MSLDIPNDQVGAISLGGSHRAPPRFAIGRICAADRCDTVLSVYNGASCCAVHDFDTKLSPNHERWQRRHRRPRQAQHLQRRANDRKRAQAA